MPGDAQITIGRLHELSYNEALRLLMLSAPLACASGADQDIDALVSYFGRVIDAEQDEPNLRGCRFWKDGMARNSIRRLRAGPIPTLSCRCSAVSAWNLDTVSSNVLSIWAASR